MLKFATAGINPAQPSVVGPINSTTMQIFPAVGLGLGFQVAPTAPAQLFVPANGAMNGVPFSVHASGNVFVHGSSPTINFALYNGTSLTAASNGTAISTLTSAQSLTTAATYPFSYQATLQGDSTSGVVQVIGATFYCNGVSGTLTNTDLTGITFGGPAFPAPAGGGAALSLCLGIKFGVGDALDTASLMSFYAEA
jgi:hypothetical protein